jgi:hydroxypyruvate isomerase
MTTTTREHVTSPALQFSPNLSFLWTDRPLEERFERAAAAGFDAVELAWPGDAAAKALPDLTRSSGVRLALLNFDGGDLAAGDRGLISHPDTIERFRENVPIALEVAEACGCAQLNALLGRYDASLDRERQLEWARENVAWAAGRAAAHNAHVLVEPVNVLDNGEYLIPRIADAAAFIRSLELENVGLQCDIYHMQREEGNLATNLETHWDLIRHVQIADCPGRHEPGTGEINYPFLFALLQHRHYDGFVGLEYRPSTSETDDSFGWLR